MLISRQPTLMRDTYKWLIVAFVGMRLKGNNLFSAACASCRVYQFVPARPLTPDATVHLLWAEICNQWPKSACWRRSGRG